MSKIKLILLDVDGTTVESQGDALPSERVIEAVQAAQNAGIHVALATGRPLDIAHPVFEALGLTGISVLNGGSELWDLTTETILSKQTMSIDQLRELVQAALPFGFPISTEDNQYNKQFHSIDEVTKPAAKIFIEAVANDKLADLLQALNAVPDVAAHPTSSWTAGAVMDVHVTHDKATKQHGVEQLMARLGINKDQTMAIGDSHNDIPLLEAAGLKVVMGNGPDEVKAIADYVAPSLAEDGVADAIYQYALAD